MLNLTATPLQNCHSTSPTSSCRSVHQLMSCRGWGPEHSSTGLSISNYTALQVTDISAVVSVLCGLVTLLTPSVKKAFLVTPDLVLCHGPWCAEAIWFKYLTGLEGKARSWRSQMLPFWLFSLWDLCGVPVWWVVSSYPQTCRFHWGLPWNVTEEESGMAPRCWKCLHFCWDLVDEWGFSPAPLQCQTEQVSMPHQRQ